MAMSTHYTLTRLEQLGEVVGIISYVTCDTKIDGKLLKNYFGTKF